MNSGLAGSSTYNANALHEIAIQGSGNAEEILEISATVTARGQTTVPAAIRKVLALGKRDRVVFGGLADGTVVIAKKETCADGDDPVIGKFLEFLARGHVHEPAWSRPLPRSLVSRAKALVKGVEVDVDAPLPDDEA